MSYDPETGRLTPGDHDETSGWIFTPHANIWHLRDQAWVDQETIPQPVQHATVQTWYYRHETKEGWVVTVVETNLFGLRESGPCDGRELDQCSHRFGDNSITSDMFVMKFGELEALEARMERDGFPDDSLQCVRDRQIADDADVRNGDPVRTWVTPVTRSAKILTEQPA